MRTLGLIIALACGLLMAAPARAAGLQTVGCSTQGYIMFVPSDWAVTNQCQSTTQMKDTATQIQLVNNVEKHSFWNDTRARASIKGDVARSLAAVSGTAGSAIIFKVNVINGRHFMAGLVEIDFPDGTQAWMIEQQAFYAGYMYKFTAFTALNDAAVKLTGQIWSTIRLLKHP